MPRGRKLGSCLVCEHADVARIDAAHAAGVSFEVLAGKYKIAGTTLKRHWRQHVSAEVKLSYLVGKTTIEDLRERAAEENLSVLDYCAIVRSGLFMVFKVQVEHDDAFRAAAVAGKIIDLLREIGRITGEISAVAPSFTINNNLVGISAAPNFPDLMAAFLDVARKHPAARADIIAAVERLGGQPIASPRHLIEHADA